MEVTWTDKIFEDIVETIRESLLVLDQDLRVISASRSFYEFFKATPEETVGQLIYDLGNKQWDIPKLRELLETILPQKTSFDNYEVEHDFATIGRRTMLLNARQIEQVMGKERIILLAIEDITERKAIETGLETTRKELAIIKKTADEAHEFADSVINTVREPLIALDQDLRVVSVSRSFYDFFKVSPEETMGQLIYDLGNKQWDIPKLRELLETILPEKATFDNYEVEHDFATIGRRTMLLNARQIERAMGEERIILLAIEDITARKEIEAGLETTRKELAIIKKAADDAHEFADSVINTVREPLISLDQDLRVVTVSRSFYEFFQVKPEETVGQLIYDLGNKQWDIPKLRELLETILPQQTTFDNYEVEHDFATIGRRTMLLNARQIEQVMGKERIILLAIEDITERKAIETGLEKTRKELVVIKKSADEAHEFAESVINTVREPLIALDQDLRVVEASRSFYGFFKVKPGETVGQLIYDLGNKQWNIPKLRELLETILPQKTSFDNYEVEHDFATIGRRTMLLNARQIERVWGKERIILLAIEDITERKQLENLLTESEERFRRLFETAVDGILLLDKSDGGITHANPAITEMLMYNKEECIGKKLKDIGFSLPCDDIKDILQELDKSGTINYDDVLVQTKVRQTFSADIYMVNRASLVQCNIRDITAHKRAKEQILWQSKVLKAINKVFREALICESDLEVAETCLSVAEELTGSRFGVIGEVNPAGRFDTIAISNPGWDTCKMPESDSTVVIKGMEIRGIDRSTIREEKSRIVNDPASHPDRVGTPEGHPPITSFLGVPLKHAGKTIGMIGLGNKESGYDLSDQQAIEDLSIVFVEALMRKRAEEALKESEQRFRTVAEYNYDWEYWLGPDGKYVYVSPSCERITGYSAEEFMKDPELLTKIVHPDDRETVSMHMKSRVDTEGTKDNNIDFRIITAGDDIRWISHYCQPVHDENGNWLGTRASNRDITDRIKLEAQFRQSQKMEGIGRLAGGIAHDFNNLLTTIIGYTDIMLMKLDKESPFRSGMEEIKKASDRAANLTSQLLAFSRKQVIQPVVLNINYSLTEMDKMLRPMIGEDVDLVTILEPELWKVKFDPGQVDQVVMNLAVNAKDAMPEGGKLTIETANVDLDEAYTRQHGIELKPGPFVMVAVSDTGMGIDEETQSQIFDPFFTTKEKGKGTGLGLSTVYGIVKQSGGFIWVYSEPGQGTTFKIYLPKAEAGEAFMAEEQIEPQNLEGSETILLAEDDDSARKLIRSVLQDHGYSILEAQDGEEALRLAEQHEGPIHLLLTDVVMPGINGRELAERLQPLHPKMKILYMSGYTDNAIVHHGVLESGMQFIPKPFAPEVLASKVRKVLDTCRRSRL